MPGPAKAGVLIYAKNLESISLFYEKLLGMKRLFADAGHHVIESADMQLIIHAIPEQFARDITISSPPELRENQAIKPFFTVSSLAEAERVAAELGGRVYGQNYSGPGFTVRNACDPEGNILQIRQC